MPSQNRVGCHDGGDAPQPSPAEALADDGKATALLIAEPNPSATELRAQRTILFAQKLD